MSIVVVVVMGMKALVSRREFLDVYADVSAVVANDAHFAQLLEESWACALRDVDEGLDQAQTASFSITSQRCTRVSCASNK